MLRYYESMGLISPNRSDTHNNYREYSANDLQQVAKIKTLQALGFSLAQIKEIQQLKFGRTQRNLLVVTTDTVAVVIQH